MFHIHTSLWTESGPYAVINANPVSPIADSIIAIDSNNIQIEEVLAKLSGREEDLSASLCVISSVFCSCIATFFCAAILFLAPQKISTAGKINAASKIG